MAYPRPSSRQDFEIAIICALPVEYNAASLLFDEFWDEDGEAFGKARGDPNCYLSGRIGTHNAVLTLVCKMGKAYAASAAASLRSSYNNIQLALLVGICGVVPKSGDGEHIALGDVIISKSIVQYDFGQQYPGEFIRKNTLGDNPGSSGKTVRNLLTTLETDIGRQRLKVRSAYFLEKLQQRSLQWEIGNKYKYPGAVEMKVFPMNVDDKHCIKSTHTCTKREDRICDYSATGGSEEFFVKELMSEGSCECGRGNNIHIGSIASGDTVMKSEEDRDRISRKEAVLAFEMEGAAVWDELPCLVIKGASDYADSHKDKKWQNYAAASAASVAKAILERYTKTDEGPARPTGRNFCMNMKKQAQSNTSLFDNISDTKSQQSNRVSRGPGGEGSISISHNKSTNGSWQENIVEWR